MATRSRIFIVDDDPMFATMLQDHLSDHLNADIETFPTGEACLPHIKEKPQLVILDYHLNSKEKEAASGLDILKEIKQENKRLPVVMLSSQESYAKAAQTIASGAIHYVIKGKDAFDEIVDLAKANIF